MESLRNFKQKEFKKKFAQKITDWYIAIDLFLKIEKVRLVLVLKKTKIRKGPYTNHVALRGEGGQAKHHVKPRGGGGV